MCIGIQMALRMDLVLIETDYNLIKHELCA